MMERLSGASLEGWRLRRALRRPRERPPRAVVAGGDDLALEVARRIDGAGAVAVVRGTGAFGAADAVIVCTEDPEEVRRLAAATARVCPWSALILAARDGIALSAAAARASGLPPWLILSPGGIPAAASEAARLARRLDVAVSQIDVPVIGGDAPGSIRLLHRYATVAGVPVSAMAPPETPAWPRGPERPVPREAIAAAAALLARSVLGDRRRIHSCGAWVEGVFGLPGGFVTAPVPVGARGAEDPLPLRLTVEEKSILQAAARSTD